jgi:HK97 family phage prohead protease
MNIFSRKDSLKRAKHLSVVLDLKEADVQADGTFRGYASVWGTVDSYNEVVPKGAFKKSLAAWAKKDQLPAMLWQHKSDTPIGVWTLMKEDDRGLYVEGKLALDTVKGAEAYALLKLKALNGLSIGYVATEWTTNKKTGITVLDVIDLWEVSLVTFPANGDSRIDSVKAALEDGATLTIADFEKVLRDVGFSKQDATHIASLGYRDYLSRRDAGDEIQGLSATIDKLTQRYSS